MRASVLTRSRPSLPARVRKRCPKQLPKDTARFGPGIRSQCERAENRAQQRNCAEFSEESADGRAQAAFSSGAECSLGRRGWLPIVGGARTWKFSQKFVKVESEQQRNREVAGPSRGEQYEAALSSEHGLSRAELARRFGVSRAAVTQALRRK